ncbi:MULTISPECIES: hypothetical protein [Flavobacterium]|uniref:Secreted protein n=1 Tax=Flavobacterium suzhouense TaxID=1529638 RepID=A0ABW5NRM8_9FLAO|nr:hypothetical protein [Flavobacterium sp. AG291]RDI12327.1 hypothetical protein DEU42_104262 [Flavobacterium sp. AG291]
MKKIILTLCLVAFVGSSLVSCSADDSEIQDTKAGSFDITLPIDNGDKDLPKPPIRA